MRLLRILCCILLVISIILYSRSSIIQPTKSSIHAMTMTYTLVLHDEQGKLVSSITRPSESYVLAFIDLLNFVMTQTVGGGILDTGGASRAVNTSTSILYAHGAVNTTTRGIVVGTGTNAVAITDYALQTKIAHGTGAGQLSYALQTTSAPSTSGSARLFTITRVFTNGSGNNITVNEIGLYVNGYVGGLQYYFCAIRDVIAGGRTIGNGQILTVIYTISVTA